MIFLAGAGGKTGRRILQHARAQNVEIALGGRDPADMRRMLGPELVRDSKVLKLDMGDPTSLDAALDGAEVLINATSPAGKWGLPFANTCVARRVHYTDVSGEVGPICRLIQEFDRLAVERRITLVPGAGYTGAMGDLAMRIALRGRPSATDGLVTYAIEGFEPSAGTRLSEADIMAGLVPVIVEGNLALQSNIGEAWNQFGRALVSRPMMDAILISRYASLRRFRTGIVVPEDQHQAVADMLRSMADGLRTGEGRAQYLAHLPQPTSTGISPDDETGCGEVIAFAWRDGEEPLSVALKSGPIYDTTARIALLIAKSLQHTREGRHGVQAVSSVVPVDRIEAELGLERGEDDLAHVHGAARNAVS